MDKHIDHDLLKAVIAGAKRLGIAIEVTKLEPDLNGQRVDALIRIRHGGRAVTYAAEVRRGLRPATLGATLHQLARTREPALLVADYVTPPLAEALKERGVAFLDAAGNAYLDQPPLLVWVKGERLPENPVAKPGTGRAFQASGLKVLFALLCHPDWVEQPYREIARLAGVAHGTVGWVMAELPRLGFVADVADKRRLLQPELLLRQWAEAYARTLRPKLAIGRYRTDLQQWWTALEPQDYELVLGGEPAAQRLTQHLRPGTVTLYGAKAEPRLLLDFKLRPDPAGPVEILKRFWKFETDDTALAPLPLVYADLLTIGDARCLETAHLLYEQTVAGFSR
jgi:hypothetical protein